MWCESSYSQVIKTGEVKIIPFELSKTHALNNLQWLLKYDRFIKNWQSAFPEAKIIPRIYDKKTLPNGNVILDFLSILGIHDYPKKDINLKANPSLSHISTLAIKRINEEFDLPSEIHRKVANFLIEFDQKHKHPLKSFFTLRERIEFLESFKESNKKLFREWFNSENKFVLSEEEIEFYKKQDEILKDREKLEKEINERYEKVLEFLRQIKPDFEKYKKENVGKMYIHVSKKNDVYGYVDLINNNKIAGWILDLEENKPTDVILKINGIQVLKKKANIERKDVKEKYGVNINPGFEIFWKEIVLPEEIKKLPDNTVCNVEIFHKRTNKMIQGNYKTFTVGELKRLTRLSKEFPWIKYTLSDELKELLVEFLIVDQLYIDVLREGKLIIGGLVVLRKDIPKENYKLRLKILEKELDIYWNHPSPGYAKQHPDNPNAKNARFYIKDIPPEYPIELVLKNKQNSYTLAIILN